MNVKREDVQEDLKKLEGRVIELEDENANLKTKPELRKVYLYKRKWSDESHSFEKELGDEIMFFHGWGCDYEEFETGAGNFSTAILEKKDGTIINESADCIKFI